MSKVETILPSSELGQLPAVLEKYRYAIIVADCNEVLPRLPKIFKTAILDPPYNINYKYNTYKDALEQDEYLAWQDRCLSQTMEALLADGTLFYINYPEVIAELYSRVKNKHHIRDIIAWVYHVHGTSRATGLRRAFRLLLWLCKDPNSEYAFYGEYRNPEDRRIQQRLAEGQQPLELDWWLIEQVKNVSEEKTSHPCQIPEALLKKIILAVTKPNDIVLDPFAGSGSTGAAALYLGRQFVGIEIDPVYAGIAANRMSQLGLPLMY